MPCVRALNRREFLGASGAVLAGALLKVRGAAPAPKQQVIGFIKPIQKLPYHQLADAVAEIGWTGIECPVRKGGTIEPPAVEEELPKLVEALRKNRIEIPVLATDVEDANDPLTDKVLRTARGLGIRQYRLKHYYYDLQKPIAPQLAEFKAKLRDLAALNGELKIQGTIQNHSGKNYVGAPVWDIWELIREYEPRQLGAYFDIGHATLEGGNSWPLHAKLMEPRLAVVSVKDFLWRKREPGRGNKNGWRAEWCPLGEGMVHQEFFDFLKRTAFAGPISQHFEYEMGSGKAMIAAMKKELGVLRSWL